MTIRIPLLCRPKKNSQEIVQANGKSFIVQSKRYQQFERDCGYFLNRFAKHINYPINLKCTFYVPDRRKRDTANLIEAIQDILVKYGVIEDDNYTIVAGLDGSRTIYEKGREETIIEITEMEKK